MKYIVEYTKRSQVLVTARNAVEAERRGRAVAATAEHTEREAITVERVIPARLRADSNPNNNTEAQQ